MSKNWDPGNIVEIDLGTNRVAYGLVIDSPLMAFYDFASSKHEDIDLRAVTKSPIAFKVWVMKYAIGKNGWNIIGQVDLSHDEMESPWFYKYDMIGKRFSIVRGFDEKPATKEECINLECAAVWDPEHIISRLNNHFDGKPNKWAESLSTTNK